MNLKQNKTNKVIDTYHPFIEKFNVKNLTIYNNFIDY